MNRFKQWIPILLVFSLLLAACQAAPAANFTDKKEPRTITVQGSGSLSLSPDIAKISIGVETEADNAQEAVAANNQLVEDLYSALEEFGIPEEDLQTVNFSIHQVENREPTLESSSAESSLQESKTYRVNNTVRVTLREMDQLGNLLDRAVQAGANNVHGIQFEAANQEEANRQALDLAVQDARAKAEVIAESTGVELGEVVNVQATGGGPVFRADDVEMEEAMAAVPVSSGQLTIRVSAQVSYSIQ